ncbi:NASP isoform 8 [Pan troglodytes]|uniref:NASP isoform 8 n=1 Tax=Pan troglodytes TaxID=9598 RepID=A0A2J8M022_PANTR|nr:NASP isoform 8 [Pan troglodytes]
MATESTATAAVAAELVSADKMSGRARWLTPVIQHFGRPRWADHEVRRSRPSWLTR